MKRVMQYTAVVLLTLLGLVILWQFRIVVLFFIASLFAAAMIRPFVAWLTARGLSRGVAPMLLYGVGIVSFLVVFLLLGNVVLAEVNGAANRTIVEYEMLYGKWQTGASWQQSVIGLLPEPFSTAAAQEMQIEALLPAVLNIGRGVAGLLAGLLLLVALSIYWSVDQYRFERLWLSLLPPERRANTRDSWRAVETAMGSYMRSQIVQSVLAALLVGAGAAIAGLQFPLLLALFAAVAAFVPFVGGFITALAVFGVGALGSLWLGAGMAVYTLIVFMALDLVVEPRLWKTARRGFFLSVLLLVPLYQSAGVLGLVLATPISAALEVLIWQSYEQYLVGRQSTVQLDDLAARYRSLADKLAETPEEDLKPELRNLSQRLSKLLAATRDPSGIELP